MSGWAQGSLKPRLIFPSPFLAFLSAVPVIVWGVRGPVEGKRPPQLPLSLSVKNLRPPVCFPLEWAYNRVCEVPAHESWQSLELDGACVCGVGWGVSVWFHLRSGKAQAMPKNTY